MNLYLLPGNSPHNKEWIKQVEEALKPLFKETKVQFYKHWETGEEIADLEYESNKLKNDFKENSLIFAKSLGIVITLKTIKEHKVKPKACIFAGAPINWCKKNNIPIETLLKGLKTKALFIQNKNDPAFSSKDLKELLEKNKLKNYKLIELEGNTHEYSDLPKIKHLIEEFI